MDNCDFCEAPGECLIGEVTCCQMCAFLVWKARGQAFYWLHGNAVCQCGHLAGTHQSARARGASGPQPCRADGLCRCDLTTEDVLQGCQQVTPAPGDARHVELHELARAAINEQEPERDIVTRGEILAWLDAAADALRLHRLGHHDRELLEFVQGERDRAQARAVQAEQATADRICAWLRGMDDIEATQAAETIEGGGW
jgi:hypothetical protein